MSDKLTTYRRADGPLPDQNWLWPLYGAGFENLGRDGQPIRAPMPRHGPDQLLIRHDACGLCFSDTKVIRLGREHPRIYRDMQAEPVVLGHEVCMTVVGVGENLRDQYHVGDRLTLETDIYVGGVGYSYGYEIQGGLSQYSVIDQRALNGDHGNYLIPIAPATGYAESALVEPWACVIAAYRLTYRTGLKPGGTTWVIGGGEDRPYTISAGFDRAAHPARLLLTDVPGDWLRARAESLGVEVLDVADVAAPPVERIDDIVLLGADPDLIEAVSPRLAPFGVLAIIATRPLARPVSVDVGRVHYDRWLYVGGTDPDVARAYSDLPARSELKPGGRVWFLGAGGPMGRMHVQRAVELPDGPRAILCTELGPQRLRELAATFQAEAEAKGIAFTCADLEERAAYDRALAEGEFDDVIVLAPAAAVVAEALARAAPGGVVNVFAGLARGTRVALDLSDVYLKGVRLIGHSASTIEEIRLTLAAVESGRLQSNRSVAAVGSLGAAWEGLLAVRDAAFPGKIVLYPHIRDLPLTPLPALKDRLPTVHAKLRAGQEWTIAAEDELLRLMLP